MKKKWSHNFVISGATFESIIVWVRLLVLRLLIEYYNSLVLKKIVVKIGHVLRIDTNKTIEKKS